LTMVLYRHNNITNMHIGHCPLQKKFEDLNVQLNIRNFNLMPKSIANTGSICKITVLITFRISLKLTKLLSTKEKVYYRLLKKLMANSISSAGVQWNCPCQVCEFSY
jgi:hypothetical protein